MSAGELRVRLAAGEVLHPIDVREHWEVARHRLPFAQNIPMNSIPDHLDEIPPVDPVVIICHLGHRSAMVVEYLDSLGYTNIYDLTGGTDAWDRLPPDSMPIQP